MVTIILKSLPVIAAPQCKQVSPRIAETPGGFRVEYTPTEAGNI